MKKLRMFILISLLITNIVYIISGLDIKVVQAVEENNVTDRNLSSEAEIINFSVIMRNFAKEDNENNLTSIEQDNNDHNIANDIYVYPGETIYYEFSLVNSGSEKLTDIEFVDEKLDIKINKNGIYKISTNTLVIDYTDLNIIKYSDIGDTTSADLNALESLDVGEKITVKSKDLLKYLVVESDLQIGKVENTVVLTAYNNENGISLEKRESVDIEVTGKEIVVNSDENNEKEVISITENIERVVRDSNVIYERSGELEFQENLYPGDEVEFSFNIINKTVTSNGTIIEVENLSLENKFTDYEITTQGWNFYLINNEGREELIDINNFSIGKEPITIIAKGWKVPSKLRCNSKGEIIKSEVNTVTLKKNTADGLVVIDDAYVLINMEPLRLNIKKVIEGQSINLGDTKSTVKLIGKDSSGNIKEQFNIEAKAGVVYTLDNLTYGLTYELSEIVPMNYRLINTSFKKDLSSSASLQTIKMNMLTNNYIGVITSEYVDSPLFYDSSNKQNTLQYDASIAN